MINLNDNIKVNAPKPLDEKYLNGVVPYSSTSEANSLIDTRSIGLIVNINNELYWYKDGVTDEDLVEFSAGGFSLTNGSGTTANSTAVDLGGTTTSTVSLLPSSALAHSFAHGSTTLPYTTINNYGQVVRNRGMSSTSFYTEMVSSFDGSSNATSTILSRSATNGFAQGIFNSGNGGNYAINLEARYGTSAKWGRFSIGSNSPLTDSNISISAQTASSNTVSIDISTGATNTTGLLSITGNSTSFAGAQYAADYSTNYTNRSLVDKEYVDSVAGGASSYTFENGITENSGIISLGGELTGNTLIGGNGGYDVQFGDYGTPLSNFVAAANSMTLFTTGDVNFVFNSGTNTITYTQSLNNLDINNFTQTNFNSGDVQFNNTSGVTSINSQSFAINTPTTMNNSLTVNGTVNAPLTYSSDFSGSFTGHSIVDKAYVDSVIAGGGGTTYTFENGLLEDSGTVRLGGELTDNIEIDQATYGISFINNGAFTIAGMGNFEVNSSNNIQFNVDQFRIDALIITELEASITAMDSSLPIYANDEFSFQGFVYGSDYSANFTDRSLVDKAYVDSVAGGGSSYDASNGINLDGTTFKLGGNLNQSTSIGGIGIYDLTFNNIPNLNILGSGSLLAIGDSGTPISQVLTYAESIYASSPDFTLRSEGSMSLQSDSISVTMLSGSIGIEYASDYSSTFTSRSLVDKGYVDNLIGTNSLLGTLTVDGGSTPAYSNRVQITIDGNAYWLYLEAV